MQGLLIVNVNKSSEKSFCVKSQMTMFAAKSLHKKFFHMANALHHHNPEYVTWKYEELLFAILGGTRI